jgi:hypothetical protein
MLQALGSPTKMLNTRHHNQNDIMFAKYGVSVPHTLTTGHHTMNDEIGLPTNNDILTAPQLSFYLKPIFPFH